LDDVRDEAMAQLHAEVERHVSSAPGDWIESEEPERAAAR
jgi:hypothetical protein